MVVGPGKQVDDHVAGFGDVALASGIVEVAAEVGEGGESAAGFDEAPDDVGGFGGSDGVQSSATASAMRRGLMMVSSRANRRLRALMRRRISERVIGVVRNGIYRLSGSAGLGGMAAPRIKYEVTLLGWDGAPSVRHGAGCYLRDLRTSRIE